MFNQVINLNPVNSIFRYCRRNNTDCFPSPEGTLGGYAGHMTNTATPPHLHHPPFSERGFNAMATANRNCFGSPGIKQEPRDYGYDIQKGRAYYNILAHW